MKQQCPVEYFHPSHHQHLDCYYASWEHWAQYGLQKTQNNQRALNYTSLIIHKQWIYGEKKSRNKGKSVCSFSKAMLSDARLQSIFKFAITNQLNYEVSLPN